MRIVKDTMCKHKSGGMSHTPGGAAADGAPNRDGASSSQDSSTTNESPAPFSSEESPQLRNYTISTVIHPPPPGINCDTPFNFPDKPRRNYTFLENLDSGDETEHSPMLSSQLCSAYCPPPQAWKPNVISEEEHARQVPHCYNLPSDEGKATNCDNFQAYHNSFQPQMFLKQYMPVPHCGAVVDPHYFENTISSIEESPNAYTANKPQKKWLLNHKCKSVDSEPDSNELSPASRHGFRYIHQPHTFKPINQSNAEPMAGPSGLQRPCSINWDVNATSPDGEFRSRSYSLTPTVNFAVFESESSSDCEDIQEPMVDEPVKMSFSDLNAKTVDDLFELTDVPVGKVIPLSPSAAQLSIASSYGENGSAICKICHMTARENDPLISPCRCSGTMQYIHCGCLMRWLEVCHKRGRRPASCELCQYQYHWHKKFKIRHWTFPQCSRKDKILHLLFVFSVLLMVSCATLTIMFFKDDRGPIMTKPDLRGELTQSEIGNLVCGVLFFVAFFVAIYVEAKSHDTLYQLLVKFIHINQQWYIDEYEKKETPPVAV